MAAEIEIAGPAMQSGKRYAVYSVVPKARATSQIGERETKMQGDSVWVRAGSAWVNRDGSINVYLDVLPLDGRLHIREQSDR